jgi:hypothetical protein
MIRPLRGSLWCSALAVLALCSGTSHAAWNNVFQVTCHCRDKTTTNYAPLAPVPVTAAYPPAQNCTTRYEQRSYYEPVTVMTPYTYTEQVTTLRTSYYWDPVTTYHYSSYYDPSSCGCRKVATPTISYSLKAKTCPVTSYLERTALKPVTTQQLVTYYQPITSCCQQTLGAPISTLPPGATVVPGASDSTGPPPVAPGASDRILPERSGSEQSRKIDLTPRTMPQLQAPVTPAVPTNSAPPAVRTDRIALLPEYDVEGQVLTTTSLPRNGARVLLVNKEQANVKRSITADEKGQFHVRLTSGSWLVYVQDEQGTPVYQDVMEVRGEAPSRAFVLTSR